MSFSFQVVSDLHLEIQRTDEPLYEYDIPAVSPCLALLGDIGWTQDDRLFTWIHSQLTRFERVFFVFGNHEPYGFESTIDLNVERIEKFRDQVLKERESRSDLGEFIFLNRTRYDISPTLTVLGCTLWSALNPDDLDILSWSLTDFKRISDFTPAAYTQLHQQDLAWLKENIQRIRQHEPQRRVIVLTHHSPTIDGTGDSKYLGGPTNSAFATELSEDMEVWGNPVLLWAFGHTHWSCDFVRNGVRVYSNQRGYKEGGPGYDPTKVVTI